MKQMNVKQQDWSNVKQQDWSNAKQSNVKEQELTDQKQTKVEGEDLTNKNDFSPICNFQRTNTYLNATTSTSPPPSLIEKPAPLDLPPYVMKAANKQASSYNSLYKSKQNKFFDSDDEEDRVPSEIIKNLRNLIGKHPEGIWCRELPRIYL